MQIGYYTHQYIKKVCRGELPLTLRLQEKLAMEAIRKYAYFDKETTFLLAYRIAPHLKCVLLPKNENDVYFGNHCIAKQRHPFIYFFIDDIAVGVELEKLVETTLRIEGCRKSFVARLYYYFCEHLEWLCKQDGNKASNFPHFRNALYNSARTTEEEMYNVLDQVFTYKLKHNG